VLDALYESSYVISLNNMTNAPKHRNEHAVRLSHPDILCAGLLRRNCEDIVQ